MTKKTDFDREAILQHKQFLENDLYKHKVIVDKRKKRQPRKLTLKEIENEYSESGHD